MFFCPVLVMMTLSNQAVKLSWLTSFFLARWQDAFPIREPQYKIFLCTLPTPRLLAFVAQSHGQSYFREHWKRTAGYSYQKKLSYILENTENYSFVPWIKNDISCRRLLLLLLPCSCELALFAANAVKTWNSMRLVRHLLTPFFGCCMSLVDITSWPSVLNTERILN